MPTAFLRLLGKYLWHKIITGCQLSEIYSQPHSET